MSFCRAKVNCPLPASPGTLLREKMDYPKVSVIVIAHNEEEMLPLCLESLIQLDYPKSQLEIIVVDNKSTDRTRDIIKSYPVLYVAEEKKGRNLARNTGIRASSGTLIAFTDADCIVCKEWLKNMIKGFDDDDIGGCGGAIASHKLRTSLDRCMDLILCVQELAIKGYAFFLPFIITCNSIFRREALDKIDLFDETVYFGEDIDISWRLLLRGYRFEYLPDAVVWHRHRSTIASLCERIFRYGITQASLLRRYSNLIRIRLFLKPYYPQLKSKEFMAFFILFLVRLLYFSGVIYDKVFPMPINKIDPSTLSFVGGVIWWKNNDLINLFKISTGTYYTLEGVGARMYELLKKGGDPEGIICMIADEYDVNTEEAKKDFLSLTKELRHAGLL